MMDQGGGTIGKAWLRVLWLPVVAGFWLTACSAEPSPRDTYHRLQAIPVSGAGQVILPGVVEISRLDSDSIVGQRPLIYQMADGGLAQYDYDLWADTPPEQIQTILAEMLRASHLAGQVVTPELRVPPDWMIRGQILRFEHLRDAGQVEVRLEFSVVSARNGRLVWHETYQSRPDSEGKRPADAALALNLAAGQCLTQFLADLARLPPQTDSEQ